MKMILGLKISGEPEESFYEIQDELKHFVGSHIYFLKNEAYFYPLVSEGTEELIRYASEIINAKLEAVYLNPDTKTYERASNFITQFNDVYDREDSDYFDITDLENLLIAAKANPELNEINKESNSEEFSDEELGDEEFSDEEFSDEEFSDEEFNDKQFEDEEGEEAPASVLSSSEISLEKEPNECEDLDQDSLKRKIQSIESIEPDVYLKKAFELLSNTQFNHLPNLEEFTQKELASQLVVDNEKLVTIKENAILTLAERLRQAEEIAQKEAEEENLKHSYAYFDENQKNIEANSKVKKDEIEAKIRNGYENRKQEAISAQIETLKKKYDIEFGSYLTKEIKEAFKKIDEETLLEIEYREQELAEHIQDTLEVATRIAFEGVEYQDLIDSYNDAVNDMNTELEKQARIFEGQLDKATAGLEREKENLKTEIKNLKDTLIEFKTIEQARIKEGVEREITRRTNSLETKLTEEEVKSRMRLQEFQENLDKQLKAAEENKFADREKISELKEKLSSKSLELVEERNKNGKLIDAIGTESIASFKLRKLSIVYKLLIVFLVSSVVILTGVGVYQTIQKEGTERSSKVEGTTQISSEEKAEKSGLKVGDTFDYTDRNGNEYRVTVDSKMAGHYYDKEGKRRTVVFE